MSSKIEVLREFAEKMLKDCSLGYYGDQLRALLDEERKIRESAEGGWREASRVIAMQREKLDELQATIALLTVELEHTGHDHDLLRNENSQLKGGQYERVATTYERVGTVLYPDPYDDSAHSGVWLSSLDLRKLEALPPGTELYIKAKEGK
jgi:hypothetical protein